MKLALPCLLLAVCLLCAPFAAAMADEAGVLTEAELGAWLNKLLLSTIGVEPMNAPVGEESLTEDGYAFLYDTATLYYNKPVLDAQSVLTALSVTDEALDMPRGIRLGAPAEMLVTAYGWQNPTLAGDDTFAPLYTLSQLPDAAYWAWAQRTKGVLQSVQCAIHARMSEDRYTDTGILYTVEGDIVTGIRVYGLATSVSLEQVQANLAAIGGQRGGDSTQTVQGTSVVSDAAPFTYTDLQFSRMDFLTLTEKGASKLFGDPLSDTYVQDATNGWLHSLTYPGVSLVFSLDAQKQNPRLESFTLTDATLPGPRELTIGMDLATVLALFRSDGTEQTSDHVTLLYGDGITAPFGTMQRLEAETTLLYTATINGSDQAQTIALYLRFDNDKLAEMMIYRY